MHIGRVGFRQAFPAIDGALDGGNFFLIQGTHLLAHVLQLAAAGLAIVLLGRGFSIPQLFLVTALLNAVVAVYIFSLVPEFLMRFLAWLLIHTVHRVHTVDADLLIADFGLSRIMDEEQFHVLTTTCGTPGYMAPEIFKKTGHGKPVDLWALGVITYFLLCGYTPFDRDSDFEEMQAILNADYSFTPLEYWRGVSDSAKDFIRRCLTIDPAKRMTGLSRCAPPSPMRGAFVACCNRRTRRR